MRAIKKEVLLCAQQLFRQGLVVATAGNISARISPDEIIITPSSIPYETMKPKDLVRLNMDGKQLSGRHPASTEQHLHLECYKAFPEVGGVIHSHPKFASMFALAQTPISANIEEVIVYLGGDISVADYHQTGSMELAEYLPTHLKDRSAVLMANHGLLCVGKNAREALKATQIVERTAEIAKGAAALNPQAEPLPPKIVANFQSAYAFVRAEMWK